jgi:gamma-glutamylcyclotransferase (GGCT)/AIG2-like uncharacterized protein YtfP
LTADDAAHRLFVYGTLMMPAVLHAVCGQHFTQRPATLADFARYRLRRRVYPAIIASPGALTEGLLYEGLDAALWQRLDEWESTLYSRQAVEVRDAAGHLLGAHTYVLAPAYHHELELVAWSPQEFEGLHLAAYLARWHTPRP